jgi:hypothetical protein
MEHKQNKSDWKGLVQGFVGDLLERIGDNVSKKVHTFITQLKRRTIGAILIATGISFLLISLVIFINTVLASEFPWVGWGLVGLVVLLAGYIISKD